MIIPAEAYKQGVEARRANPTATTWEEILPYAVKYLVDAWLDGWYDATCEYRWGRNRPVAINVVDGYCPFCWSSGMVDLPDGILRCRSYPCRQRNFPAVDRVKMEVFLAQRDAGSYI